MAALQKTQPILYIVQEVCKQQSLPVPLGVFDVSDETANLMGSLANLAGILLTDNFNWQHLQDVFTVTGDGTTTMFPLPSDFSVFVDDTGRASDSARNIFVLNAQQWASIVAQNNNSCRVYRNCLQFLQAPGAGITITFQYKLCNWVQDGANPLLYKSIITTNSDVPLFDWLMILMAIKVKWREAKGMDTASAQSDLNDRYLQLTQRDQLAPTLYLNGGLAGFRLLDEHNLPSIAVP
jgi:hypothetical protein